MTIADPMKPSEGSWTEHYPELGTGLVSYEDCTCEMPEDAEHLLQLMYALIIVSFSIEAFRQPQIPDTGAAALDFTIEPAH